MRICEILVNILIGLVTGGVSGFFVSITLQKHLDKQQFKRDFEMDKQNFERYLEDIRLELRLAKCENYDEIIRVIETEPIRETFTHLQICDQKTLHNIIEYINEIKNYILDNPDYIDANSKKIQGKLFAFRIAVMKFETDDSCYDIEKEEYTHD